MRSPAVRRCKHPTCNTLSLKNEKQCTRFDSLHSDVVPASGLSVQDLAQCDGTRIGIDMEDHLLVCGPIDGKPETTD